MSSVNSVDESNQRNLLLAQVTHQKLENELLELQIANLKRSKPLHVFAIEVTPLIATLIAVLGGITSFVYGIRQYQNEQQQNREQQVEVQNAREDQSRREQKLAEQEFMKPWLENQREIYIQALSAAVAAVNSDEPEKQKAAAEFWRLYHGKMILVETTEVSGAMKRMGAAIGGLVSIGGDDPKSYTQAEKYELCHALASTIEKSMANTAKMSFEDFSKKQFDYRRLD